MPAKPSDAIAILASVIWLIEYLENGPDVDPYLWGHGTNDVKSALREQIKCIELLIKASS